MEETWSSGVKLGSVITYKNGLKEVRQVAGNDEVTVEWNDGERKYRYANDWKKMIVELVNGGKLYEGGVVENKSSWRKKNPNHRYSKWLFVPDGDGKEYDANGTLVYHGQHWHGYRYYHGEEYVNGVKVFEGEFEYDCRKNGVKDGAFVMNYKNGLVFKTNYDKGNNNNQWSVYDQKRLLYHGSLKDFLPEKGDYYVLLDGRSFPVSTDAVRNEVIKAIGDSTASYYGHYAVEDDFYCILKGQGTLFIHGKEYDGVFNTIDCISDCTVKREGKEVFFGIVHNLEYYAGFRYAGYCIEEGLFENRCLNGYRYINSVLSNVGDPTVYETAYTREDMSFRKIRESITAYRDSGDNSQIDYDCNTFGNSVVYDYQGNQNQTKYMFNPRSPLYPRSEKTNPEINSVIADEDGASSQEQSNFASFTPGLSQINPSSDNRASEDASAKTVNSQPQPGSSNRNPIIPVSEQQQIPTPDLQPEETPTYTLKKDSDGYCLNNETVSVEFEDNGATILVPYKDKDNPATKIYLKFTCDGYKYTFVKAVIRMPSPLCSIKHPKSYSDAYTRGPPDRRRPPHAERRSLPQGCTHPTQYPAFAHPCTP